MKRAQLKPTQGQPQLNNQQKANNKQQQTTNNEQHTPTNQHTTIIIQQSQINKQEPPPSTITASRIPGHLQVGFLANHTCKDCHFQQTM